MTLTLDASKFKCKYGPLDVDKGDLIHLNLFTEHPSYEYLDNKEVIIAIDISLSMEYSIDYLKRSLLAFRNSIMGKKPYQLHKDPIVRDIHFRDTIDLTLITFSEEAKVVWSSKRSIETYEEIVDSIDIESMTNMGEAITLAFDIKNTNSFTWLIVMTDGESNKGNIRTLESFKTLIDKKPDKCKIITLGYGDSFNADILNVIGDFVYVKDKEKIPIIFGNVVEEIYNAYGYNFKIIFESDDYSRSKISKIIFESDDYSRSKISKIIFDDIDGGSNYILPHENRHDNKFIVGKKLTDIICYDKVYNFLYLISDIINDLRSPRMDPSDPFIDGYNTINIEYIEIENDNVVKDTISIYQKQLSEEKEKDIQKMYFGEEKKRLYGSIYNCKNINRIKIRCNQWKNSEIAADIMEDIEDIVSYIEKIDKKPDKTYKKKYKHRILSKTYGDNYDSVKNSPFIDICTKSVDFYNNYDLNTPKISSL